MNIKSGFISLSSIVLLAGCASQGISTRGYDTRPPVTVANESIIEQPYSQVWDRLVKELSKSYYVINNIDKESRIINLSFSSSVPQEYVDCGTTTRTFAREGRTETFKYDVAASSMYKAATAQQPHPSFHYYTIVKRNTNLEGRSNIYLAPDETNPSKTRVAVNTRYILSITMQGDVFQENNFGKVLSSSPMRTEPPLTIAFNTNKPVNHPLGTESITCHGNGKLEREILGLLKN